MGTADVREAGFKTANAAGFKAAFAAAFTTSVLYPAEASGCFFMGA